MCWRLGIRQSNIKALIQVLSTWNEHRSLPENSNCIFMVSKTVDLDRAATWSLLYASVSHQIPHSSGITMLPWSCMQIRQQDIDPDVTFEVKCSPSYCLIRWFTWTGNWVYFELSPLLLRRTRHGLEGQRYIRSVRFLAQCVYPTHFIKHLHSFVCHAGITASSKHSNESNIISMHWIPANRVSLQHFSKQSSS